MGLKRAMLALLHPLKSVATTLIWFYRVCISPCLPHTCRFYPSCSQYMMLAINQFGVFRGVMLGLKRIIRCRPGVQGGEDFLPLNIKGEQKWIF